MSECKGYEVIKFVEYGKKCYVSTDYVKGRPMVQYLKYHPCISKEQLFFWLGQIVRQLELFHKCRGNPCFQYVNPYGIIITTEEKLLLLDVGNGKQEGLLRKMQRRNIREHFLSEDNAYYQKNSEEADIYGLGKTMQYILATVESEPPLTKREELTFQKIISKCINQHSKKNYRTIQELSEHFPKIKEKHSKEGGTSKRKILLTVAAVAATVLAAGAVFVEGREVKPHGKKVQEAQNPIQESDIVTEKESRIKKESRIRKESTTEKEVQLQFEMAMLYFVDMKKYEKSKELFADIKSEYELAGHYEELCSYLLGNSEKEAQSLQEGLEEILQKIEESIPEEENYRYYFSLLDGYMLLDIAESADPIITLGEQCLALEDWKSEDAGHQREVELKGRMASAYEEKGNIEQAIPLYLKLLELQSVEREREASYQKLAILYNEVRQVDKAWGLCKKGIKEIPQSKELRLLLIRMQCQNESVEREICAQTIQECLRELPEIGEAAEFAKIKQEYEITVEGENVWVGR